MCFNKTEREHYESAEKKNATRHKAKFHNGFIIDVFFLQITQCVLSRGVFYIYSAHWVIALLTHKQSSALTENSGH